MLAEQYNLYSRELSEDEVEDVMGEAVSDSLELRIKGAYSDYHYFIEPNGSGFDMVRLIESESGYTPKYFHIGDESVNKEDIGLERAEEMLSYNPCELLEAHSNFSW